MDLIRIGSLIANRRKELGMTQEELAAKLHVTKQAISKWERDIGYPDILSLKPLADVLEVSVDGLLGGEVTENSGTKINTLLHLVKEQENMNKRKRTIQFISLAVVFVLLIGGMYLWQRHNNTYYHSLEKEDFYTCIVVMEHEDHYSSQLHIFKEVNEPDDYLLFRSYNSDNISAIVDVESLLYESFSQPSGSNYTGYVLGGDYLQKSCHIPVGYAEVYSYPHPGFIKNWENDGEIITYFYNSEIRIGFTYISEYYNKNGFKVVFKEMDSASNFYLPVNYVYWMDYETNTTYAEGRFE